MDDNECSDPGFVFRGSSVQLMSAMERLQRGFWIEDHFTGEPPDGTKSGSHSWVKVETNGGDVQQDSAIQPDGAIGTCLLQLPFREAPVAADGAGIRLRTWGAPVIISPNDMIGEVCSVVRLYNTNAPKLGADYYVHLGVIEAIAQQAESTDGFYLYVDDASPNWILKHRRAGATVVADTGLAVVDGAWQTLAVVANVDEGIVQAWGADDGDALELLAEVTPVNIQPAAGITSVIACHNGGNLMLAADISLDYVGFGADYGGVLR